jgi:hypothetical protein
MTSWEPKLEDVAAFLARTPFSFKFKKGERLFSTTENSADVLVGLNLRISGSAVEAVLVVQTTAGHVGSPFTGLARDTARLDTPDFERSPPFPRPSYSDQAGIEDVLGTLVELYGRTRLALLSMDWRD